MSITPKSSCSTTFMLQPRFCAASRTGAMRMWRPQSPASSSCRSLSPGRRWRASSRRSIRSKGTEHIGYYLQTYDPRLSNFRAESLHLNLTTETVPLLRGRSGLETRHLDSSSDMLIFSLRITAAMILLAHTFNNFY